MSARKYFDSHGKLSKAYYLAVDQHFLDVRDEAKKKRFDFNTWARDTLYSRLADVERACGEAPELPDPDE